jgi:putative glutamine amidotransferase
MPPRVAVARWVVEAGTAPTASQQNYLDRVFDLGLTPVDLIDPRSSLDDCAGLVLTGGIDIDPSLYGEAAQPEVDEIDRPRDEFELTLLREALEADLPVLAICRGHQLLNVCFGGGLLQHVAGDAHRWQEDEPVTSSFHDVSLSAGSKLHAVYGSGLIKVNSRHHQAVTLNRVAKGLVVTGTSDDGLVEGLESPAHRWVVGVQWHPERPEPETPGFAESSRLLWQAFASVVRSVSD